MEALHRAITGGLVRACHDCSEGGIGVALAEMAFAGDVGASIDLSAVPVDAAMREDFLLFSESNSRFLVEVEPDKAAAVEKMMKDIPFAWIGETAENGRLVVKGVRGTLVDERLEDLKEAWQKPLRAV